MPFRSASSGRVLTSRACERHVLSDVASFKVRTAWMKSSAMLS